MSKPLILAASCVLTLALPRAGWACEYTSDMPPRVETLRDVILPQERYAELAHQWDRYRAAHPRSALATVNWLRAKNYARDRKVANRLELLQKAVDSDPDCPEALIELADEEFQENLQSGKPPMEAVRARFERAAALAPDWPKPHFYLFNLAALDGESAGAARELEALVRRHGFPSPLLDFGYNILVSADPRSIVLTNGDNDTYPTLAVRDVYGVRSDVQIVNLSLLNLVRYAKAELCGSKTDPGAFTEDEIVAQQKEPASEFVDGRTLVASLLDKVASRTWTRPVYFAATVPPSYLEAVNHQKLQVEGLLLRVLPATEATMPKEHPLALAVTDSLLTRVYRLESASDFNYAWSAESAVGRLMWNYFGLWYRGAGAYAAEGDLEGVRRMLRPAVAWLQFHPELRGARDQDPLPEILAYWKELDPSNPEVDRAMQHEQN